MRQAMRECEAVQLDPLCVMARNHDLTLMSRVLDYHPEQPMKAAYEERGFFDYGATLFFYPMEELPYWRVVMETRLQGPRYLKFRAEHPEVFDEVRRLLRDLGPLGNRDLKGPKLLNYHYRGGKDTAVALFYMWLTGELMTHSRRKFERVYDFLENVAPSDHQWTATREQAARFFARKRVAHLGLAKAGTPDVLDFSLSLTHNPARVKADATLLRQEMLDSGALAEVSVEGWKGSWLVLGEDLPLVSDLSLNKLPAAWKPLATTNEEEVLFLAPLEVVSARGRAKIVFDFDYIWEVYKPAHKRRWGYYTLPILWGDRLIARMDARLDRPASTLRVPGYWAEDEASAKNMGYMDALRRGLARFTSDHGADQLDASVIPGI